MRAFLTSFKEHEIQTLGIGASPQTFLGEARGGQTRATTRERACLLCLEEAVAVGHGTFGHGRLSVVRSPSSTRGQRRVSAPGRVRRPRSERAFLHHAWGAVFRSPGVPPRAQSVPKFEARPANAQTCPAYIPL